VYANVARKTEAHQKTIQKRSNPSSVSGEENQKNQKKIYHQSHNGFIALFSAHQSKRHARSDNGRERFEKLNRRDAHE